ncbi:IclR family transcriptional regulator [Nocardia sp. NPDC058499]|uniref:IclR family transcriptional regulator n=1 Tax=Nocardia sp. NPDC058499 TaxID=3346530 RepID=UPI00365C7128
MTVTDLVSTPRAEVRELPQSMVERMTAILDAFEGRAARLSLEDVADYAGLPRSTVHRILHQLVGLDWIEHTASGYRLGRRALGLAGGDGGRSELRAAAAPLLHQLHLQTGLVVHLTVLEGGDSVYLDKVGGRFATCVPSRVGGRVPAYATAGGKAFLAGLAPESVDALYDPRLRGCTDRTVTDLPALHQELNRIRRRNGLALEHGESAPGVSCVGAAIRGYDGPVAGISLCGDTRSARLDRVAPLVADAARTISRTLYPQHSDRRRARGDARIPAGAPETTAPLVSARAG